MTKPLDLLILSFSPIRSDPRVLKQVELFREKYRVTTCGFGEAPDGVVAHYSLPDGARAWPNDKMGLLTRNYAKVYAGLPAVISARELIPSGVFDIVLANDLNGLPLALDLKPRLGVHSDLHEYAPSENEAVLGWRLLVAPYARWICKKFLPEASSVTTVSRGIAEEYAKQFGVDVEVVANAAPFVKSDVRPTGETIRYIYSGAGQRYRKIELILEAMKGVRDDIQLDLVVMPNEPDYLQELKDMASTIPNVNFIEPVPYQQLVALVREYDNAMCFLPNTTFNLQNALPNKFFEAVQARIGVVVGPSPAMIDYIEEYDLGAVVSEFTPELLRKTINEITVADIDRWKNAANSAAHALSAEEQMKGWAVAIDKLANN